MLFNCYIGYLHSKKSGTLDVIFNAIVLSVVTYALPSFAGQLSKADKGRLDNLFRKALRRGVCSKTFTTDDLISAGDKNYFTE